MNNLLNITLGQTGPEPEARTTRVVTDNGDAYLVLRLDRFTDEDLTRVRDAINDHLTAGFMNLLDEDGDQ